MEFTEELKTFLWAMTPIGELRVAIPMGLTVYKLSPVAVYFFSVMGNLFSVLLVLGFLGAFSRWASDNVYFFNRFFVWLFSQTRKNHYDKVNKYGLYLLPFFVAVPLPITGGWTAALIAFVFGMPFKKAFPLIGLGILAAGLIVSFLTKAGIAIESNFGWQALIGVILISGFIYWFYKRISKNNRSVSAKTGF
jgi:uncharacterized membrane protein